MTSGVQFTSFPVVIHAAAAEIAASKRYPYPDVLPRLHHYVVPDPAVFHLDAMEELVTNPAQAINGPFLNTALDQADEMMASMGQTKLLDSAFILDIDLDYFTQPEALKPEIPDAFHRLLKKARAITIAREPGCVRTCSNHTLTVDITFAALEKHLLAALGPLA